MTDRDDYADLKARLAPGLAELRALGLLSGLLTTAERALEVAAAQLREESRPDEFTATSRAAALRTVEAALATLRYGGGEEG